MTTTEEEAQSVTCGMGFGYCAGLHWYENAHV